jgi:hypothetical protein
MVIISTAMRGSGLVVRKIMDLELLLNPITAEPQYPAEEWVTASAIQSRDSSSSNQKRPGRTVKPIVTKVAWQGKGFHMTHDYES